MVSYRHAVQRHQLRRGQLTRGLNLRPGAQRAHGNGSHRNLGMVRAMWNAQHGSGHARDRHGRVDDQEPHKGSKGKHSMDSTEEQNEPRISGAQLEQMLRLAGQEEQ
jgi:hypothetical protein